MPCAPAASAPRLARGAGDSPAAESSSTTRVFVLESNFAMARARRCGGRDAGGVLGAGLHEDRGHRFAQRLGQGVERQALVVERDSRRAGRPPTRAGRRSGGKPGSSTTTRSPKRRVVRTRGRGRPWLRRRRDLVRRIGPVVAERLGEARERPGRRGSCRSWAVDDFAPGPSLRLGQQRGVGDARRQVEGEAGLVLEGLLVAGRARRAPGRGPSCRAARRWRRSPARASSAQAALTVVGDSVELGGHGADRGQSVAGGEHAVAHGGGPACARPLAVGWSSRSSRADSKDVHVLYHSNTDIVLPVSRSYCGRMTTRISHWIDGRTVRGTSGRTAPVYNPATGR